MPQVEFTPMDLTLTPSMGAPTTNFITSVMPAPETISHATNQTMTSQTGGQFQPEEMDQVSTMILPMPASEPEGNVAPPPHFCACGE